MGVMGCFEEPGNKQWITYECVGKGKVDVWTYDEKMLRSSLEEAIKKMGIKIADINEVLYNYTVLNINNTVKELAIPNGGVVLIKLKQQ